jgi:AMP-binding enzyme
VTARYRLESVGGAKRTRSGSEYLGPHRDPDDRYRGDNGDRKDNADTPDQAPLALIAASPRPVSRQGSPFVGHARLTPDAGTNKRRHSGCGPARYMRRAAGPLHLTRCAHWPAAQVPLALNNARKTARLLSTSARKSRGRFYRAADDVNHETITLWVTNEVRDVIAGPGGAGRAGHPRPGRGRVHSPGRGARTRERATLVSAGRESGSQSDSMETPLSPVDFARRWLDYEAAIAAADPAFERPDIDERDLISINYTSGTTARPKGVMITHRNAALNTMGTLIHLPMAVGERYLWTLPMFHANGWTGGHHGGGASGGGHHRAAGRRLRLGDHPGLRPDRDVTVHHGLHPAAGARGHAAR